MEKRYYIDTSIWRDYYENRADNLRPLGEWAFEFFKKMNEERNIVLFSDLVVEELLIEYSRDEIEEILRILHRGGALKKVEISAVQQEEARKFAADLKIPRKDALHAILARDNGAILVTRDAHFLQLKEVVEVKKPEELI